MFTTTVDCSYPLEESGFFTD